MSFDQVQMHSISRGSSGRVEVLCALPTATRRRRVQARSIAYRRLVATILGLDVATLAGELRARRLESEYGETAA